MAAASSTSSSGLSLLSLSVDTLLDILPFLEARSLINLSRVSRLFGLLVKETQAEPLFFTCRGDAQQIKQAILKSLPTSPSVGLLFKQPSWSTAHTQEILASLPAGIQMIGSATSDMCCCPEGQAEPVTVGRGALTLMHFPETSCSTFLLRDRDLAEVVRRRPTADFRPWVVEKLGLDPQAAYKVFVVLGVTASGALDMFLEGLQDLYPDSTIIGGMAESAFRVKGPMKTEVSRSGLVGLALAGNVPLHAVVSQGVKPVSPIFTVTGRVCGGGQKLLMIPFQQVSENGADTPFDSFLNMNGYDFDYLGMREVPAGNGSDSDEPFVIKPFSVTEDGDFLIPGRSAVDVVRSQERLQVCFCGLEADSSMEEVRNAMQRLKKEVKGAGQELQGALMFSCNGRGPKRFLGVREESVDLKAFRGVFPHVPLAGFYAYGEIGPDPMYRANLSQTTSRQCFFQSGNVALQGFTAMFCVFIVPERKQQRRALYSKVHEAVAAAVAAAAAGQPAAGLH